MDDPAVYQAWLFEMDKLHRKALKKPTEESHGWVEAIRVGARWRTRPPPRNWWDRSPVRVPADAVRRDRRLGDRYRGGGGREVGAGLRISQGLAASKLRYARALRERLPKVGEVFCAGDIDFRAFTTIVYRTDNITDPQVWRGWTNWSPPR